MSELKKVLSYRVILLITINSILGTGIFFLPAVGAGIAGPASLLSWVILAFIAIYISMCFAELTSMYPKAGGVYEFCKHAYGRFPSFMIGWMTLLAGNITIAMLVVGAIQYLLPANVPQITIPISLFFVFAFNYIAYRGMQTSAVMLVAFAIITLTACAGIVVPGLFKLNVSNFSPFFALGIAPIFLAIFFIAETFFGWETATFLAEEVKDGERVMPKVLITATVIIAIICLLVVVTSLGVINWSVLSISAAPFTALGVRHYGHIGETVFTLMVYMAIIGSVAGWIVSAPRLVLSMARDRLFLTQFAKIHPKYHSPYKAILFQTVLTSILVFAGAGSYNTLLEILLPMVLIMYSAVLLSLVVLRYKKPDFKRYYRAPFGKVGPIIVVALSLAMLVMWLVKEPGAFGSLNLGFSFVLLGIPVYFLIEMYYSPKAIRRTHNLLAHVAVLTEDIFLPKSVRKEIIGLLGDIKGKRILEFGASVGTLTKHLAEKVTKKGKIYATDISEKDLAIAEKRLKKLGHKHVKLIHDPEHMHRIHPSVPKVDALISVGTLGYVENVHKVLKDLNKRMNKGARVVFMDYDKFFDLIPNIEWLTHDKKIILLFKNAGFKVAVIRKQGFAWKYIYIYGVKVKNIK